MKVVSLPASLDYRSLEHIFAALRTGDEPKILFDARHVRWVDPVGMIGLLCAGRLLLDRTGERPGLRLPDSGDVSGYMQRMGFGPAADDIFSGSEAVPARGAGASDVLLEITSIAENRDVHDLIEQLQDRAGAILSRTLRYPPTAVLQFSVILSEVCQNILEHAGAPGWVAAQAYFWKKRLGRPVLIIGVGDVGRGFKESLTAEHSGRFGDRWGDATALEAAFIHGLTRFPGSPPPRGSPWRGPAGPLMRAREPRAQWGCQSRCGSLWNRYSVDGASRAPLAFSNAPALPCRRPSRNHDRCRAPRNGGSRRSSTRSGRRCTRTVGTWSSSDSISKRGLFASD